MSECIVLQSAESKNIDALKQKVLSLAIQGKLVPQDPNDEPASVLLEKIKAEKAELVKQGKIKKDKQESYIFRGDDNKYYEKVGDIVRDITEEIPFEIPDSWEFIRLKNLSDAYIGLLIFINCRFGGTVIDIAVDSGWLNIKQAALFLGVKYSSLLDMRKDDKILGAQRIPYIGEGKNSRYYVPLLKAYKNKDMKKVKELELEMRQMEQNI